MPEQPTQRVTVDNLPGCSLIGIVTFLFLIFVELTDINDKLVDIINIIK